MNAKKIILITVAVLLFGSIGITGINILQNSFGYKGESAEAIMGKKMAEVTVEDIKKLSKSRFLQLYYSLPAPEINDLNGEYLAANLPSGIMAAGVDFYTDHFFGPGKWTGKAFRPVDAKKGTGYNIFSSTGDDGKIIKTRTRRIDTYVGKSAYDERDSYHLDYSPYNSFPVDSMHDELRKVNDHLFIGVGHMAAGGGSINPSPFMIFGEPASWVGPQ